MLSLDETPFTSCKLPSSFARRSVFLCAYEWQNAEVHGSSAVASIGLLLFPAADTKHWKSLLLQPHSPRKYLSGLNFDPLDYDSTQAQEKNHRQFGKFFLLRATSTTTREFQNDANSGKNTGNKTTR